MNKFDILLKIFCQFGQTCYFCRREVIILIVLIKFINQGCVLNAFIKKTFVL